MTLTIQLARNWTLGAQRGKGGYGRVFEAVDEDGTPAAIKLVEKKPGADREPLIAREVSGVPNVVEVFDSGEYDNHHVLVMPLADRSLQDELNARSGPVSADEAVGILIDVAGALVGVAERGVVHRDVKPANVLLIAGAWHLADFGIARYAEAATEPETFKLHGSAPYTAPERWRSERATPASDVYSFGVMAYQMLAGQLPFAGPAVADFADQHQHQDPTTLSGIPPRLASIVIECLYKAPAARPSAANILNRLRSIGGPSSPGMAALEAANRVFVDGQAKASARMAVAQTEAERRAELLSAASHSLAAIVGALNAAVSEAAPSAAVTTAATTASGWARSLGPATLFTDGVRPATLGNFGEWRPSFDLVAFSAIGVRIPRDRYGYEGRSHSLWYGDVKDPGDYHWYETAFMISPLVRGDANLVPFALPPSPEAAQALGPWIGTHQAAWPFTPIDQGSEGEFLDRWLTWFALGAQGDLHRPASMPERSDAQGSWRR